MTIAELIRDLPVELVRGSGRSDVSEIVEDSRCASTGCLFVARAGTTLDGRAFIAEAVAGGAVAVLTDQPASVPPPVARDCAAPAKVRAEFPVFPFRPPPRQMPGPAGGRQPLPRSPLR